MQVHHFGPLDYRSSQILSLAAWCILEQQNFAMDTLAIRWSHLNKVE